MVSCGKYHNSGLRKSAVLPSPSHFLEREGPGMGEGHSPAHPGRLPQTSEVCGFLPCGYMTDRMMPPMMPIEIEEIRKMVDR